MGAYSSLIRSLDDVVETGVKVIDDLPVSQVSKSKVTTKNGVAQLNTPSPKRIPKRSKPNTPQEQFNIEQQPRIDYRRDELDEVSETLQNIEESNIGVPKKELEKKNPEYKAAKRKKKKAQAAVSSEESNVAPPTSANQYAFPAGEKRAVEIKGKVLKANEELGRTTEVLEMHHLFPKGISAAIYNKVRDFIEKGAAKSEDLVRLNDMIKGKTGVDTGDLESNILAMRETPHSTFHGEMRYQPSMTFEGEAMEISKEALTKQLRKVKNMKDLESLLEGLIDDDIMPLIQNAKDWENMDDLIKSVSPEYTGKARYKPPKK